MRFEKYEYALSDRCCLFPQKSDGCNKMVCWRCNTYFCWLCATQLSVVTPYEHFRNPRSPCHNMLFHGAVPDDGEADEDEDDLEYLAFDEDYDSDEEDDVPFHLL